MKIAFIGSGVMGYPMITHLINAGHELTVYNRSKEKTKGLETKATIANNLLSAVKDAQVVFSIVGYPTDVKEIYETIIPNVKKGTILVDMTTSSPTLAINLAKKAEAYELSMLDAPVTGGDLGAKNQTLSIMVGGDKNAFDVVLPLLTVLGKTITYMGKSGSGQHMKLSNQITIAGNIAGIAEGLTYARAQGLDLNSAYQVITNGSASSWQAVNNGLKMIKDDYTPGFYIKHFLKDLNLAIEEKKDLDLPILTTVRNIYDQLSKDYYDEGTQAIIAYYLKKQI
ncbi:MAG: NAD(P)-dependent oxidoreductase [Paracholeplasma sp.]|nr:NAD(P)-dependent oxidoreductase [Paracholeplasma sp.]MDY3195989.1 NAD(P)-dependent oxidoreductase [Paracholeplasma sp.]